MGHRYGKLLRDTVNFQHDYKFMYVQPVQICGETIESLKCIVKASHRKKKKMWKSHVQYTLIITPPPTTEKKPCCQIFHSTPLLIKKEHTPA